MFKYLEDEGLDIEVAPRNMLDGFVGSLMDQDLSAATIQLMTVGARTYIEFMRRNGSDLPEFFTPDIPKVLPHNPKVLSDRGLVDYLLAVEERVNEPMCTLMRLLPITGLRAEEAVRLKLEDIEVQPDPDYPGSTWVVLRILGKGRKKRVVPILRWGNGLMASYLSGWRSERTDTQWLFPKQRGSRNEPLDTRSLRDNIQKIRDFLGMPDLTPHALRRTYMTTLDRSGVSPMIIAQIAGHSRPAGRPELQTLSQHYIHHDADTLMRALRDVRLPIEGIA